MAGWRPARRLSRASLFPGQRPQLLDESGIDPVDGGIAVGGAAVHGSDGVVGQLRWQRLGQARRHEEEILAVRREAGRVLVAGGVDRRSEVDRFAPGVVGVAEHRVVVAAAHAVRQAPGRDDGQAAVGGEPGVVALLAAIDLRRQLFRSGVLAVLPAAAINGLALAAGVGPVKYRVPSRWWWERIRRPGY